ncbi:Zn-dependent protease (includes SpoIVFB) [Aquiflexum balticum DSM 16537]|uniref:Zinc metalloprotease n=1 Tax=Aquiflexum balticum DSM 16537 TaxID=758820 RepID=A0A1W2H5Z5_9BACT|nr:site-2 protease family protein [Aquiflexum balticum]SMD44279.1 Zn-dependent protease (includes SpoIVFB) [Aquiflexum balticum DSM 16537]
MKFSLFLGKYKNVKVFIHWTFSLLLLWIIISNLRQGMPWIDIFWIIIFVLALFFCVVLHEFGHALAAQKYGIQTKDIVLYPIGGIARLEKLPEDPKQELWVAIAGPLVNIGLFIILSTILSITGFDLENLEEIKINPNTIILYLASANLVLALFNLLPAFPMDGGRVLRAFLAIRLPRAKATQIAGGIGQFLAIFFIFFGLFNNPILVLIGLFIFLGAGAEVSHTQQESFLKGYKVNDALMLKFQIISFDAPLSKAVEKLLNSQATHFVVVKDDVAIGTLSRNEIIKGLQEGNESTLVEKVADFNPLKIETQQDLDEAWRNMMSKNKKVAFVIENGHFLGILDQENISEFVMVKSALTK